VGRGLVTPYYQDDLVTIYHGDCREMLDGLEFDVIVADPPYGIGWDVGNDSSTRSRARTRRGVSMLPIQGDDAPFDPAPLLAFGLPTALFGANHYADRLPSSPSWIVWDKRDGLWSNDQSDCEMLWTNLGGPARIHRLVWNTLSRVKDERTYGGSLTPNHHRRGHVSHPTEKPVALLRSILGRFPEGVVLDPYAGVGSTLIAAKSLGRKSIGIEIEERYCEIAATRCSQEVLGLVG